MSIGPASDPGMFEGEHALTLVQQATLRPESAFIATDQTERELIWDALTDFKALTMDAEDIAKLDAMIERVSHTFSWMRDAEDPAVRTTEHYRQA